MPPQNKPKKTIVVLPAYNAEATLERTIAGIPLEWVDEIVLVDDASKDKTVETAKRIAAAHPRTFTVSVMPKNGGYGYNQKNCYRIALLRGADIVVMLHPDYQYDPKLVKPLVEFISDGYFDVMLGTRIRSRAETLAGGMPAYKYYSNRILSFIQNVGSGRNLSEWHTGMRAYSKEVLASVDYEKFSDDFIFDTQMLFAIVEKGYSIGDIPVPVRYFKEASSINLSRSCRYGVLTLWETLKFVLRRYREALTYIAAGALGVLTNLGVYVLLLRGFRVGYMIAALVGFFSGALTSFILQKYWTFRRLSLEKIHREILLYASCLAANALANDALLFVFVRGFSFDALAANVVSNAVVALWSFFLYKYVVFKK